MKTPMLNRFLLICLLGSGLWALLAIEVAAASNRVALVVGNADYELMPLDNPINDARAMSSVLAEAGFDVVSVLDADLAGMQNAMLQFAAKLSPETTALVYYAGHGIQSNGRNYLLPVDVKLESERSLRFEALSLNAILEELDLSGARTKLVILDACRNNPFERKTRGASRGLAAVDAARGTLIAYATAPGATAADGSGENGLYTASLIRAMREPGLKVEEVFKQTRIEVSSASDGAQVPWESSSLTGDLIFIQAEGDVTVQAAPVAQPQPATDRDAIFWQSIESSSDPRMFQAYLDQFPEGTFRSLAELRLSILTAAAPQADDAQADDTEADDPEAGGSEPRVVAALAPASVDVAAAPAAAAPVATIAAADPDNSAAGAPGLCGDLSGSWNNQATGEALCAPETLVFTGTGPDSYAVEGRGCGVRLSGTAVRRDRELALQWKMTPCSGVTTYTLGEDCRFGRGPIEIKRSFLCKPVESEGIISFKSREPGMAQVSEKSAEKPAGKRANRVNQDKYDR